MKLRIVPIPLRLVLAISVPVIALLSVVGIQVNERSITARDAAAELDRTKALGTLAAIQTANVLPDLAALRQRLAVGNEGGFVVEIAVASISQSSIDEYLLEDDSRAQMAPELMAYVTPEAIAAFDRQRQSVEVLVAAANGGDAITDEIMAAAQAARLEADLALATLSSESSSNVRLVYNGAIDAGRSATVEFSYVLASLLGLKVINEDHLAELGGVRANATQRVIMSLEPDLRDRVQDVLASPAKAEWDAAVADARAVVGGRGEPWSIPEVVSLTGPAFELQLEILDITALAVERMQAELIEIESDARRGRSALLWITGLLLAVTAGLTVLILQSVLTPLRRLSQRASDLAEGTLDGPRIDHGSHDALADLGNTIEDVADGLRHLGQQFEAMVEGDFEDPSLEKAAPGLVGTFVQDWVQEVREASGTLKAEASQDQLTGLLNRRGLADHLGRMAGGPEIAVVYIDLDKFKAVNDNHGHRHGDAVLKVVARRLLGFVREEDPVCRLGGDEFVLLVTGVDRRNMPIFTSRIEIGLAEPISFEGVSHVVGASVGVGWLNPGDLLEPILEQADREMLAAKADRSEHIPR